MKITLSMLFLCGLGGVTAVPAYAGDPDISKTATGNQQAISRTMRKVVLGNLVKTQLHTGEVIQGRVTAKGSNRLVVLTIMKRSVTVLPFFNVQTSASGHRSYHLGLNATF